MGNEEIGKSIEKIRELLDIEAPEGNSTEDSYEDILKHNLWGIHIKRSNDALSETNPHVCIGWSAMGDMSALHSIEDFSNEYDKHYDKKTSRGKGQDIGMLHRFVREVHTGDYIIFAETTEFHIGKIVSDYYYDNSNNPLQDSDYTNIRKVIWLKKNISRTILSDSMHKSLGTAMSIFSINDYRAAIVDILKGIYKKDDSIESSDDVTLKFKTNVNIPYERNRIVFGAPGTGKSFILKSETEKIVEKYSGDFERVTFHPDYTYSQFVGTYKPVMDEDGEKIKYEYVPGPFIRVLVQALKSALDSNSKPYILLIEEINRAKVAAVFGDIFQLLDRDENGVSEYEIQTSEDIRKYLSKPDVLGGNPENYRKLRIPNNMFIWSTMNSADQGVYPMDTAFKRRWNFEYLGIDEKEADIDGIGKIKIANYSEDISWNKLRKAINAKMSSNEYRINEDKLMGPFFLSKKVIASDEHGYIKDPEKFIAAFKSKVIMYLYEDAIKQSKHKFFDSKYSSKYSSICEAFDVVGMDIFGANFASLYYEGKGIDAE